MELTGNIFFQARWPRQPIMGLQHWILIWHFQECYCRNALCLFCLDLDCNCFILFFHFCGFKYFFVILDAFMNISDNPLTCLYLGDHVLNCRNSVLVEQMMNRHTSHLWHIQCSIVNSILKILLHTRIWCCELCSFNAQMDYHMQPDNSLLKHMPYVKLLHCSHPDEKFSKCSWGYCTFQQIDL